MKETRVAGWGEGIWVRFWYGSRISIFKENFDFSGFEIGDRIFERMSSRALGNDFAHLQQDNAEIERSMLAQEVEALRTRLGLRQVDVSKECGVNASMLSQWMLGRYKGNIARINGLMEGWLVSRRGGKPIDKTTLGQHGSRLPNGDSMEHMQRQQLKRKPAIQMDQYPLYKYPKTMAAEDSSLVPIRLDVDVDGYRYIDSFLLSTNESDFTYETLSSSLIRDLDLPDCFYAPIIASLKAQLAAAKKYLPWSAAVKSEALYRIYIKLRINDTVLLDTFEWDLHNSANDPEHFARSFCADMGLSGDFELAIAMSIRDQLQQYAKGHLEQQKDQASRLPPVSQPLRDMEDAKLWEPKVRYVLAEDVPVLEREDFKRMRPTSMPAPQPMLPYFPVTKPMPYYQSSHLAPAKPNRPPKPVNTFLIFCRQWRKKLMAQNPTASAKEASKLLGDMWQKLTEAQRASYQPLADKENAQRMLEWKRKEGDGAKLPAGDFSAAISLAGAATPHVPAAFAQPSGSGAVAAMASPTDAMDDLEGDLDEEDEDEEEADEDEADEDEDDE
ncbi:SWI/SNF-related matrix-associated actin-dependent regulator of chromatin [Achlya hypogyna]|uniref:SWI/SNF-related matrix-associated actin-dependent regulator of chromatin n=1 Tax=Achlya hypogyna TaxID=1202772 RepID=A0A1V9ZJU8_ACHHY|nr:SWI/SNF-related matrix-associated actin-dependent regulator of chromatin [Achlya hypogyna]